MKHAAKIGMLALVLLSGLASASVAPTAGEPWVTDFEAARVRARSEGKHLLIDFTGSDWCGYCKKLHKELYDKPAFLKRAQESYVLVELDFPRRTAQAKDLRRQNQALQQEHDVRGFPTLLLMTPDGRVYTRREGFPRAGAHNLERRVYELGDQRLVLGQAFAVFDDPERDAASRLQAAATLVETLGNDTPADIAGVLVDLDPADARGLRARLALQGFEQDFSGGGRTPDFAAMERALLKLADQTPTVTTLGDYHAWRALALAQTKRIEEAQAALLRAQELETSAELLEWVAAMVDAARVKAER